jgi:formylglycine-generating enzyme required for sulfatase activity
MALQKRVSELPAVTTVAGTDLLIVSSNSATKRTSVQQIGAYFAANGVAGPQGPVGPAGAPGATNYTQLTNVPSTFPPSAHGHTIADVSGLQAALDGKQAAGSYATLVGGKVPESQLPPIVTTWEGLTGKPSTFPPSAHSHAIGDVTGLQTALDGKAASSHTHTIANVTGLQSALDAKATPADVTSAVASVVNAAPASLDTLKELADALGNDANFASTVTNAIAGKAAAVHTHVIGDVTGLQTALDGKQASGSYAASVHTHGISDVTGLQTALDGKQAAGSYAAATHGHSISDVTGLQTALDGKQAAGSYAAAVHTHGISDVTGLQTALDGKAAASHGHAIADVTGLQTALDGKQASGSYAAASHGHVISDVTGLQTALDGKSGVSHTHTALQVTGLTASLDAKYPLGNTAAYAIPTLVPLAVGTTGRPSYYGTYDQEGNVEEYLQSYGGPNRDNPAWQPIIGGSFYSGEFGSQYPITYRWLYMSPNYKSAAWGFRVATLTDPRNYGGFVTVGDVGNANNADGFGGVAYEYRIGRYNVTVNEWVAFLNAVAKTDANNIFFDGTGGSTGFPVQVLRTGSPGSYVYTAAANQGQKPAAFMRWTDAARYCNWLHNNKPTGAQGAATTEDGAYTISSTTVVLLPNANAQYRLPTESEWIKAGRYKGGGTNAGYWKFSTQSDDNPDKCMTDLLGSGLATVASSGAYADLSGRPTLGTAAAAATTDFVAANDARLTDQRTPTDGSVTTAKLADASVTDAKIAEVAASKLTGTVATARLGSGATSTNFLRGDSTYADPVTFATTAQAQAGTATTVATTPANARDSLLNWWKTTFGSNTVANGATITSSAGAPPVYVTYATTTTTSGTAVGTIGTPGNAYYATGLYSGMATSAKNWAIPQSLFIRLARHTSAANSVLRVQWGEKATATAFAQMNGRGIGVEIRDARLWIITHNGTALTQFDTGIDVNGGQGNSAVPFDLLLTSSGGTVSVAYSNAGTTLTASTTGGPTTLGSNTSVPSVELTNGASAVACTYFVVLPRITYQ